MSSQSNTSSNTDSSSSLVQLYLPSDEDSFGLDVSSGFEFYNGLQEIQDQYDTATSRRRCVERDRVAALEVLYNDYLSPNARYNAETFRERFRVPKDMFLNIVNEMEINFEYFQHSQSASGAASFAPAQKVLSAIRQLATGEPPENYDDYFQMAARTGRESLQFFCNAFVKLYHDEYLRSPTTHDVKLLYEAHRERHGIPGMIGSIDCTHWQWRGCPREVRGQYHRGDHSHPSVVLEAIASQDLWFWHAFFGPAGSNNDLNVLNQSPLFIETTYGNEQMVPFEINGNQYKRGYYLADGIYHNWPVFVKSYVWPIDIKERKLKKVQEAARKDVERAFGALKGRFKILERPARHTEKDRLTNVIYTCMILHNMIIKHDNRAISPTWIPDPPRTPSTVFNDEIVAYIRNEGKHWELKYDMKEHIDEHLEVILDPPHGPAPPVV